MILMGCKPVKKLVVNKGNLLFDYEGHRGCRGLMPENTIPAMLNAVDLNVTTLEMDTHISKDLKVIVSHDPWFNADITMKPDGSYIDSKEPRYVLYQMTYDSIKQFDVGIKPHNKFPQQKKIHVSKPLLEHLIDSVEAYCRQKNKQVKYNIEIKSAPEGDNIHHPKPEEFADLVMNVLKQKKITNQIIIQSFDFRSLQYMHTKYPQIKASALIDEKDKRTFEQIINDLGFAPAIYSPHFSLITDQLIKDCHNKGIRVIPWTINDLPQMKRLKIMGVDGLISDYPNLYSSL
jgi:glycerophosphoryl diester phosphodiesterase